jgi:Heme/copper-type cytochrome/quinol oxidases, subunit 1
VATKTEDVRTIVGSHQTSEGNAVGLALSYRAATAQETICTVRLNVVVPHGKSEGIPMVDTTFGAAGVIQPAEVKDVELYHPKSWVTKYVFCQDAKVIAIQYSITALSIGLVALVLSWLIRLQLAFPSSFSLIGPRVPAIHHHARDDHGDLFAHRAIPGGLRELPDPADGGCPGHGFSPT